MFRVLIFIFLFYEINNHFPVWTLFSKKHKESWMFKELKWLHQLWKNFPFRDQNYCRGQVCSSIKIDSSCMFSWILFSNLHFALLILVINVYLFHPLWKAYSAFVNLISLSILSWNHRSHFVGCLLFFILVASTHYLFIFEIENFTFCYLLALYIFDLEYFKLLITAICY